MATLFPTANMSEEDALRIIVERYRGAISQIIENRCAESDRVVAALEARVLAAEEISRAAAAQMTAVLAVLNVLSHLAPPATTLSLQPLNLAHGKV